MISTSNYVARTFGVRSAMPGFIAKKLCPHLVFIGHEQEKYKEASGIVKNIMLEYDPNLTSHSLDEFFLDITAYTDDEIRRRIQHNKESHENAKGSGNNSTSSISADNELCGNGHVDSTSVGTAQGSAPGGALNENHTTAKIAMTSVRLSPFCRKRRVSDLNCSLLCETGAQEEDKSEEVDEEEKSLCFTSRHAAATAATAYRPSIKNSSSSTVFTSASVPVSAAYRRQVACEVVNQMRRRVYLATGGLTCSAGIIE